MNIEFGKISQLRRAGNDTGNIIRSFRRNTRIDSCLESGKRNPSYEKLMEIALLFGVSMDWMFGNTDNKSGTPTIDISALNNPQINIVRKLVSEFKRLNKIANAL